MDRDRQTQARLAGTRRVQPCARVCGRGRVGCRSDGGRRVRKEMREKKRVTEDTRAPPPKPAACASLPLPSLPPPRNARPPLSLLLSCPPLSRKPAARSPYPVPHLHRYNAPPASTGARLAAYARHLCAPHPSPRGEGVSVRLAGRTSSANPRAQHVGQLRAPHARCGCGGPPRTPCPGRRAGEGETLAASAAAGGSPGPGRDATPRARRAAAAADHWSATVRAQRAPRLRLIGGGQASGPPRCSRTAGRVRKERGERPARGPPPLRLPSFFFI